MVVRQVKLLWRSEAGIGYLYETRFGKTRPDVVLTLEEAIQREKKVSKREAKLQRRLNEAAEPVTEEEQP